MDEKLTPQQQEAVENRGGKLLVSAAAGSGKTKVLVDRLMKDILDPVAPCNIDDFLIITYTKAAAAELRGKIAAKLSEHLAKQPENRHLQRQMQRLYLAKISTVHSFCTDLLREYAYELDLPGDFRVVDETESGFLRERAMEEVLERAYSQGLEDPDFRSFVDTQGLGRTDRQVPQIVAKVYDASRCHLDPEAWLDHCVRSSDVNQVQDAAQTVWGRYLMEDLMAYLDGQIHAMEQAVALAQSEPGLEKVEALLEQALKFLHHLRQAQTWDQVVERREINYGTLRFPKKADAELAEQIKAIRNGCKDGLGKRLKVFCDPSSQVLADLNQTASAVRGLVSMARAFGKAYGQEKKRRRVLDFSDLEHNALDLLVGKTRSGPTRIAREVGNRFREVLVDEYQDSNQVQDALFSALTKERQNCFMVGDVKQSIYQFRLADPGIFLEKYHRYVDAEQAQGNEGRKVMLSSNFRSGGAVLEGCNDVFRRCMTERVGGLIYGDGEALREGIAHEPLGEPEVELHVLTTTGDSYTQEAHYVARRIEQLLDGTHMIRGKEGLRPILPEDVVILLRSPGSVGRYYQQALAERGIRSSFGNGGDLLQTGEISLLRSLLQVIANPRQDIPLIATLASPVFGFGADDLARIRSHNRGGDFYDALHHEDTPQVHAFLATLQTLRNTAQTGTLAQLLEEIFCRTRLDSIYAAMDDGVERTARLRQFYQLAMDFEATSRRDLSQFLEHLELLEERGIPGAEQATGGVTILSIHKSKGLEYPVVVLASLSRSFNREDLRAPVLCDKELGLGLSGVDHTTRTRYPTIAKRAIAARANRESLSEEMRVLYVAMTRARDRLIMTYGAKTPEQELAYIARCLEPCGGELLAGEVSSPGEWVLMEAMCRTEAGALFSLAEAKPECTRTSTHAWQIQAERWEEGDPEGKIAPKTEHRQMSEGALEALRSHLAFRYDHLAATQTPSKQTATQLKGRQKDHEAAENTIPKQMESSWRKLGDATGRGKAYGTAIHAVMEHLDFRQCDSAQGLEKELQRLIGQGLLSQQMEEQIDREGILAFFQTELGKKIQVGNTLREFKFSILDDGEGYDPELAGEQILLQGVVDCALIEEDGITIVDFKTDYVTEDQVEQLCLRYQSQVEVYARAMARIWEKPVKQKLLYSFRLRRLVELS